VDLILRNANFEKKKPISKAKLSAETGLYGSSKNDFEITTNYDKDIVNGDIISCTNTEWGGKVFSIVIENNIMKLTGKTFRGQMELVIVNPFQVLTVSGTDSEIIQQLFSKTPLNYNVQPTGRSNKKSITIPVGSNLLKAVDLVLNAFGETMEIKVTSTIDVILHYSSVHRYDYSQEQLILSEGGMMPTAIHAIGKVNGVETSLSVYLQKDGSVGTSRYYTGFYAYEIAENINDNCATKSELQNLLTARLLALRSSKPASEVDLKIDNARIGDEVNVSILKFGRKSTQKIVAKSIEINNHNETQKIITGG
jgi:hypothetical protein